MAQRNLVLAKHYYRRWFMGLTLSPAYRFFHEKKIISKYKRFNTTATYFNLEDVLNDGFDIWWDKNQIRMQSAIPTSHLENFKAPYSLTSEEMQRMFQQIKIEYENNLIEEDLQLDNLTIIDNSSGIDHKEIDFIDKLIYTRSIKFIKEMSDGNKDFKNKIEYQKLKLKNIFELVEPNGSINYKSNRSINSLENRVSEWNADFYRIFWYAQLGYFYYDSNSNGKVGKSKERKFLESKTPNFLTKGNLILQQANFFDNKFKDEYIKFVNPANEEFFSLEKVIKILATFCPSVLDYSEKNIINQLPSPWSLIKKNNEDNKNIKSFINFPDDNQIDSLEKCEMLTEILPHMNQLFSSNFKIKLTSAYKIAEIFLAYTEVTDTLESINPIKLKIISSLLPFLFSENKNLGRKKYGSLTLLWRERPNLFVETENMFFGKTILLKNNINI